MALFGIASSPFSSTDSIQFMTLFSVQNYLASFLLWAAAALSRSSPLFWMLNSCSLSFSFMICASDKLYLKTLGQCPRTFVDKRNTNEFFLTNPAEKRWHSLDLWLTSRCPCSIPKVCTDSIRLVICTLTS